MHLLRELIHRKSHQLIFLAYYTFLLGNWCPNHCIETRLAAKPAICTCYSAACCHGKMAKKINFNRRKIYFVYVKVDCVSKCLSALSSFMKGSTSWTFLWQIKIASSTSFVLWRQGQLSKDSLKAGTVRLMPLMATDE